MQRGPFELRYGMGTLSFHIDDVLLILEEKAMVAYKFSRDNE